MEMETYGRVCPFLFNVYDIWVRKNKVLRHMLVQVNRTVYLPRRHLVLVDQPLVAYALNSLEAVILVRRPLIKWH